MFATGVGSGLRSVRRGRADGGSADFEASLAGVVWQGVPEEEAYLSTCARPLNVLSRAVRAQEFLSRQGGSEQVGVFAVKVPPFSCLGVRSHEAQHESFSAPTSSRLGLEP